MQACQRDRYIDPAANKRLNPYKLTPGSPRRGLPHSNGDVRARSSKAKAHLRPAARGSKNTENNDTSKRGLEGRWDADPRRYPKPYIQYKRSLMIQQRAALRHATGTAGWTQEQLKEGIQVRISRRRTWPKPFARTWIRALTSPNWTIWAGDPSHPLLPDQPHSGPRGCGRGKGRGRGSRGQTETAQSLNP